MPLMNGETWMCIVEVTELFSMILSLPINSLLLYCILKKSPKELGDYKYLMIWFTVQSMFYSVLTYLTHMGFHIHEGTLLMFTVRNILNLPNWGIWILFGICSASNGTVLLILSTQFVYRYLAMSNSDNLKKYFSGCRRLYFVLSTLFVAAIYGACGFVGINSTPEKNLRIRKAMAEVYGVLPDDVNYMGIEYFDRTENNELVLNWLSIGTASVICAYFSFMVFVILYCGIKTYKTVCKGTAHLSIHMHIQRQLFIALLVQTLTPTIFFFIPCAIFYVLPIFEYPLGVDSNIVSVGLVIYPILDPIGVMYIVKNYRIFLKSFIQSKTCCIQNSIINVHPPEERAHPKAVSNPHDSLRFNSLQSERF